MANPLAAIWESDYPVSTHMKAQPRTGLYKPITPQDHSKAKAVYEQYLVKSAELKLRQAYAARVVAATGDSRGMTPVAPLATMGCSTNGYNGALLCDHCLTPIILEGGLHHNVPVHKAWSLTSELDRARPWTSWIKGGMAVVIVENETVRIYHGYNRPGDCDFIDAAKRAKEDAAFVRDHDGISQMWRFIDQELLRDSPMHEKNTLFSDVVRVMFSYDPGFGVNHD